MIVIETKSGSSVEKFIELLKQKQIGWIFTSKDMGMNTTDAGNCIERLASIEAIQFVRRVKISSTHSLKQYQYVQEVAIKAKAGDREGKRKKMTPVEVGGVWAELFILPAPIVLGRGCTVHSIGM